MLDGPQFFPSLRAAEEAALADALERRRMVQERMPAVARPPFSRSLRRMLSGSRTRVEQCRAELEEAGPAWRAGTRRA